MSKYKVIKDFKSHCGCKAQIKVGEVWTISRMRSKKRADIILLNQPSNLPKEWTKGQQYYASHKVKLSRALTNSVEL